MDLNIHDVIVRPIVSTKARRVGEHGKQFVVEVHPQANKPMVVRALKFLFNVDVASIRAVVRKGKRRALGRRIVQGALSKRMYVTLKAGQAGISGGLDVAAMAAAPVVVDDRSQGS